MIYKIQDELRFGANISLLEEIPVGNWLLSQDEHTKEFFLVHQPDFKLPEKIYGNEEKMAQRYIDTFNRVNNNVGVLFTGQKGNGKSLTAKLVCQLLKKPVIIITQPFIGEAFQNFLGSMTQEVAVFIDEFEKVYPEDDNKQENFLPILDGVFQSKKLFLFTSNSMNINPFLKNRPGRIRYLRKYEGLEMSVMQEIIDDRLENKEHKEPLRQLLNILSNVSMDVLLHLIEEINFYDETPLETVRMMNIQVEHSEFDVLMYLNGKRRTAKVHYNPLTVKYIYINYKETDDRGESRWKWFEKEAEDFDIQAVDGEFIFKDADNNKLIFTASKPFEFNL